MGALTFGGQDFSGLVSCEVVEDACVGAAVGAMDVPGNAGKMLLASDPGVRVVRCRLRMLGAGCCHSVGFEEAAGVIGSWLARGAGGDVSFRDGFRACHAVCTKAGAWIMVDGAMQCEVEFTCYDPVLYGEDVSVADGSFTVGGSWRTWPVITLEASADADEVSICEGRSGRKVAVAGPFVGGERVVVDCLAGTVVVDGVGAEEMVNASSDFFCLNPGAVELTVAGCTLVSVAYAERWV